MQMDIKKTEPKLIFRTERLYFRTMTQEDFGLLCQILQDEKAMYAYEHAFSDEEVREWLNRQLGRYEEYGFGLWMVHRLDDGEFLGQAGLTMQDGGGRQVLEIGYLFKRAFWHTDMQRKLQRGLRNMRFACWEEMRYIPSSGTAMRHLKGLRKETEWRLRVP